MLVEIYLVIGNFSFNVLVYLKNLIRFSVLNKCITLNQVLHTASLNPYFFLLIGYILSSIFSKLIQCFSIFCIFPHFKMPFFVFLFVRFWFYTILLVYSSCIYQHSQTAKIQNSYIMKRIFLITFFFFILIGD